MKGRKPIPAALKRLNGDGIHDSGGRVIPTEPQAQTGAPETPEELTGDALLAWHHFTEDMATMGTLTHADRAALIMLSQKWALMQDAARNIEKTGSIIKLPNGIPAQTPYLKVYNEAAALVMRLLGEFGLTPVARTRLAAPPPDDDDGDDF